MTSIHPDLDRRWFTGLALAVAAFFIFVPRIPQAEAFHQFADGRAIAGVPNFWNVISNLPFAVVGIVGLRKLRGVTDRVLFTGVLLTCFESAYYHWAPSDARLVWDRLPMTVIFMSFLTCVITRGKDTRSTVSILALLLVLGVGSVIWWRITNDLRPYAVIKFGPILLLLPFLWLSSERAYLWAVLGLFALAQVAELCDRGIYSLVPLSGHTIKHLVAGLATFIILRWRLVHYRSLAPQLSAEESMATIGANHDN
jgi:hypothetical protein